MNSKQLLIKLLLGKVKNRSINETCYFTYRNYYEKIGKKLIKIEVPFEIPSSWYWIKSKMILSKVQYGFNGAGIDNGKYKLLRITDIQNNSVNWNTLPFCNIEDYIVPEYQVKKYDIFIARTGGTIGKSFLLCEEKNNVVFAGYLIRLQLINKKQNLYIAKYLGSPLYWNQVAEKSAGTGQPNINGVSLSNLLIPIPPIIEQERILKKLDAINNLLIRLLS